MPGVSLLQGDLGGRDDAVSTAFDSVRFFDSYREHRPVTTDRTILGYTGYGDYPVQRFETEECVALLEGYLYGAADTAGAVRAVTDLLAHREGAGVREWLTDHDGDFLLAVHWKDSERVTLLNDTFARLPTYYVAVGDTLVVSRELRFLRTFANAVGDPLELDSLTAAHQLLFGYTLGERTTFEGVRSLPPGSLATLEDGHIQVEQLHQHDLEQTAHDDRSVEENAAALADRFADACQQRVREGHETVLSLSGGLDSRAIAGLFADRGVPFRAVTFDTEHDAYADDARVARTVAERLDVDWSLYRATSSDDHDETLLATMQGMNYLAMSFIIDFFEQLAVESPGATYVTGDGGDKILVDISGPREFDSDGALVDHIVEANSKIPLPEAAAITGVSESRIRSSLRQRVDTYPEESRAQQYAHFLLRERGLNFLNHGEDRNRYYFWSATPFYSLPVFQYAMNCPDEQKQGRKLYTAFLEQFAPDLLDVEYPNYGAPINSLEYRLKRFAYGLTARYPALRESIIHRLTVEDGVNEDLAARIQQRLAGADVDTLSTAAIIDVLEDADSYRSQALYALFTVIALADDVSSEASAGVPHAPAR